MDSMELEQNDLTPTTESSPSPRFSLSLFDKVMLGTIAVLTVILGGVLYRGDQVPLQVSRFSWEGKRVGVNDQFFTLSFNRPVNRSSIAENLTIDPPLPGKISWRGNQLFYTLSDLPIYGTNYQLKLPTLQPQASSESSPAPQSFVSLFSTRPRVLLHIGIDGEERGRLIMTDITDINQRKSTILTPRDIVVTDFEIYPDGDKVLFSAFEPIGRTSDVNPQQLYTVTTGLGEQSNPDAEPAGRLQRVLTADDYQNLQFSLSKDGKTIVVLRQNRNNPAETGLWVIPSNQPPRPLGIPGTEFVVSPEGKTVSVSQQGGVGIFPLTADGGNSQFLSGYLQSLGFSPDGQQQLMVRANPDYTRSLVLLDQQLQPQELFRTANPLLDCKFDPRQSNILYCLKIDLLVQEDGNYREEPFLSVINLEDKTELPLLALPNYREVQLSMSPDGVALLFDQVITAPPQLGNELTTEAQQAIIDGRVWLLPLPELEQPNPDESIKIAPEELEPGFKPQWIP